MAALVRLTSKMRQSMAVSVVLSLLAAMQVGTQVQTVVTTSAGGFHLNEMVLAATPSHKTLHLRGGALEKPVRKDPLVQPQKDDAIVSRSHFQSNLGGWNPVSRKVLKKYWKVPLGSNLVKTVPEAVEDVLDGRAKRVFVGNGKHEWQGTRIVVGNWRANEDHPFEGDQERNTTGMVEKMKRRLAVVGEGEARMWGMWFTEPESWGAFTRITAANEALTDGMLSTVEVWGVQWDFTECDLRSTGGIALKTAKRGKAACSACVIGGIGGGEKDEFGDWIGHDAFASGHEERANFGVYAFEASQVFLERFTIEFTGLIGAGLKLVDRAQAEAKDGAFSCNSIAVHADDATTAKVVSCRMVDNDMGSFYAGPCAEETRMVLLNNSVEGKLWFDEGRPGAELQEEHFVMEGRPPTFSNESFSDMVRRIDAQDDDGLDLVTEPDVDAAKRLENAPLSQIPLGAFARMYASARASSKGFDPENQDLGKWWMTADEGGERGTDEADTKLEDLATDEGLDRLRHQVWRAAGFPAGVTEIPEGMGEEEGEGHPFEFLATE